MAFRPVRRRKGCVPEQLILIGQNKRNSDLEEVTLRFANMGDRALHRPFGWGIRKTYWLALYHIRRKEYQRPMSTERLCIGLLFKLRSETIFPRDTDWDAHQNSPTPSTV